jgi:hypothetical protein
MLLPMPVGVDTGICANCGQPLGGPFCSACGEEAIRREALTIRHFVRHTVLEEGFDLDGKLWRTIRGLLFRPGFLTAEYWSGRRRAYIGPFKLLLIAIVGYALFTGGGLRMTWKINDVVLSLAPVATSEGASVEATVARVDQFGLLSNTVRARANELRGDDDRRDFHRRLAQFAQPISFTNVLLLAAVLSLLFWRRRLLFVQHCTFAMHCMAFVLIAALVLGRTAIELLQNGALIAALLLNIALSWLQVIYLGVAVRRFYLAGDRRRLLPALKAASIAIVLFIANAVFLTAVQLAGAAVALWLV